MNERFEKLAEQATEYATFRHPVSNIVLAVERDKFEQKFAELIVRECMNICYRTDTEYEGKKVKSTVIASKVAEHFGVEE